MNGDGRDFDDADWLLAQLAAGRPPARQDPPVAPPPADVPKAASTRAPEEVTPAVPSRPSAPAPRREEVLDWFSLAEPPSAADAATRALPVIGGPPAPPSTPTVVEPPAAALPSAVPPPAPSGGLPSWNPPFTVGPAAPVAPAAPVGPAAPVPPAAAEPPASPAAAPRSPFAPAEPFASAPPSAPAEPVAPVEPFAPAPPSASIEPPVAPPPGPVTPTGPFALTWGGGDLDSEDAIRAAFRSLSKLEPSEPAPIVSESSAPADVRAPDVESPSIPAENAPAANRTDEIAPDESASPFAGFTTPPVARQSFTPAPSMVPPPLAEEPPAAPVVPPRHPIAPTTAPAGWDERAAHPAPTPRREDELWSASTEAEPPAPAPPAAEFAPPAAEPVVPAPSEPEPDQPASQSGGRFGAFASDTFAADAADPFRALIEASSSATESQQSPEPPQRVAAASEPTPPTFTPSIPSETTTPRGFPFIEVRGEADDPVSESVGTQAESAANRRAPFPAFAAAGGDRPGRDEEPPPGEPVDDLLAALGSGTSRPSRDSGAFTDAPADRGSATPPDRGGPPSGGDEGFDALGIEFGDDDADADDEVPDDVADEFENAPAGAPQSPDSPIARELAETGYFWNLTPDPSAADPKADAFAEEPASEPEPVASWVEPEPEPEPVAGASWDEPEPVAGASWDEPQSEPEPEPEPEPFAPEPQVRAPFTASLFATPSEPEPEPEPEPVAAEPSWSFGDDDVAGASDDAGYREDAPTAMFPPAAGAGRPSPNAIDEDDDPLAALFGSRPAPSEPMPIEDPWKTATPLGAAAGTSAPADRFAADAGPFVAYTAAGVPTAAPATAPRTGGGSGTSGSGGGAGGNRTVRVLAWVAGGLVAALVLVGLFFLGAQLSGGGGEATAPSATPSATETPVAAPTAPQPVGVHAWNSLFGGECIEPFESAWAEEFSVVDCATPHAAQLVYRGLLPGDATTPFPGEAEIASQMNLLCTAPGVIEVTTVEGIDDLQVQAAFPVTEEQWTAGERTYYCFANRAGGEPLTGSIAGPGPAV